MSLNTTPRTWVAGETVTAALMNTEIRDALTGIEAAWTAYSPTAANFTVGSGTLLGRSSRVGKTVDLRVNFAAGGTTSFTASGATVTLPFAAHATSEQVVPVKLFNGAGSFSGFLIIGASSTVGALYLPTSTANCTLQALSTSTVTTGTTGNITAEGSYEGA